jgi:hypothetical protein
MSQSKGYANSDEFYQMHVIYQDSINNIWSHDLRAVLKNYVKRTGELPIVDVRRESGIAHIDTLSANNGELSKWEKPIDDKDKAIELLISELKATIVNSFNPKIDYLMSASGGMDSRILLHLFDSLDDVIDLSRITIISHEPEIEIVEHALSKLKHLGEKAYHLKWNYHRQHDPDYYWLDEFGQNISGFVGFPLRYHPKDWDLHGFGLITGNFNGELFEYPSSSLKRTWFGVGHVNEGLFRYYCRVPNHEMNNIMLSFKSLIFPYLSKNYLNTVFNLDSSLFRKADFETGDYIRTAMLEKLGNTSDIFRGHSYNMRFSVETRQHVKDSFLNSTFYKTYSNYVGLVGSAKPWLFLNDKNNISSKIYSLASTFEGVL